MNASVLNVFSTLLLLANRREMQRLYILKYMIPRKHYIIVDDDAILHTIIADSNVAGPTGVAESRTDCMGSTMAHLCLANLTYTLLGTASVSGTDHSRRE